VTPNDPRTIDDLARSAIAVEGIESAVVFTVRPTGDLGLGGAAGVEGAPLDALVAAVRNPAHPITRTLADGTAWNVTPMAPGGPRLRSHVAIATGRAGSAIPVGVLALAHDADVSAEARRRLEAIADTAADLLAGGPEPDLAV
jgi:hypothetical protein